MGFFAFIAYHLIGFFILLLIISIIASWLIHFNVINPHNQVVRAILQMTYGVTEPVMRPVRQVIPPIGGIDLSPIVVIIVLNAIQGYVLAPMM